MSDNNSKVTSDTDNTAAAIVADDNNSAASGTLVSGGNSSGSGVTSGSDDSSAYSTAALSSMDRSYYAGDLSRASLVKQSAPAPVAPTKPVAYNYRLVSRAQGTITSVDGSFGIRNTTAGYAYSYTNNLSGGTLNIGANAQLGGGGNAGHAVFQNNGIINIGIGNRLTVGSGDVLLNGDPTGSLGDGNLTFAYTSNASPALVLNNSAFLSAHGYLGGVADKGSAGGSLDGKEASRTGGISAGNNVSMVIDGDFGTIGDIRTDYAAVQTVFGANNKLYVGGNFGIFLNASVTVGSNTEVDVMGVTGSGFFVGSGAYYNAAAGGKYYIVGGMGAAYSNNDLKINARLTLGNNTSVTLDQANWGDFAAEAGGVVSVGNDFYLRALEISVGYGQNPVTGAILGSDAAKMTIGNNARIFLAQSGLKDNGSGFYLGADGAIVLDAQSASLIVGAGANIIANNLSIGNYTKDYSGIRDGVKTQYSWYTRGSNNSITIGNGATINLSGGVRFDGQNNALTLQGGTYTSGNTVIGNTLNAGYISAGRFYVEYNVPLTGDGGTSAAGGAKYKYDDTSVTNFVVGDGYQITLASTGGLNTGNIEARTNNVNFKFGNNVDLTANSMVLGDYKVSTALFSTYAATLSSVIGFGANATVTLSGAVIFTGSSNKMTYGNSLTFSAGTMSLGSGGVVAVNNSLTVGTGAVMNISNGITNTFTNGSFTIGDNGTLTLSAGNFTMNGAATAATTQNLFSMGVNGKLLVNTGAIVIAGSAQTMNFGSKGYIAANQMTISGNRQTLLMGNGATLSLTSGVVANATSTSMTFGTNASFAVGGWNLKGSRVVVSIGDSAMGSLGNMTISGLSGSSTTFITGKAASLTFGAASLVSNVVFSANGIVSGSSLSLTGGAAFSALAGANIHLDTLTMDGVAPVYMYVGSGATLNVGALHTNNVGSTDIPKIVVNGGHVVVAGLGADTGPTYRADFNSIDNGIYEYDGYVQDVSSHILVAHFVETDKLIFNIQSSYIDETKYTTSVVGSQLVIMYNGKQLTTFTTDSSASAVALAGVKIIQSSVSPTGYQIVIQKCFVTGTHILTPDGEVCVESLNIGDQVVTLRYGQQISQSIVWIGSTDIDVSVHNYNEDLYPVRIRAHAFGLNQPCRDLLVTPEHTIYVDGGLIPARMLVNSRSIFIDKSQDVFTVHHIETKEHSIVFSENLATESYLNTDDHHLFDEDVAHLHLSFDERAGHKSWMEDAAAPLMVGRGQVEPVWHFLDRRATQQGYVAASKPEVTNDPSLCLITQRGERVFPVDIKGNTYSFYIAANVCVVAMHSKTSSPFEVIGPFVDDRRQLGVLVSKINVLGDKPLTIDASEMYGLSGWYEIESGKQDRWTKGLATLPEAIAQVSDTVKLIQIELAGTVEYFVDDIKLMAEIA